MAAQRVMFLVDMQSFYASVEKAANPHLKHMPVAVAGDPARRSGIVLAACPIAKKRGVAGVMRLGEAYAKCPELVVIRPRMQHYISVSLQISDILERFSDLIEPFSIDEQFVDVTGSLPLFGGDAEALAQQIQTTILHETGVYARAGIGPNKVLAKMACDNFAKKRPTGIFTLTKESMPRDLWPLPIDCMFGVGGRMRAHFERMGILTIGDLARFPLEKLQQRWGINGHVLWMTANGMDNSPVSPASHELQKGVGHQMTLPRDYATLEEINVVLLELSEEVCRRARRRGLMGATVAVGCRGADFDRPTGFYRQAKLADPTNHGADVYDTACRLFAQHWNGLPIRSVAVALTQLREDDEYQLQLFRDRERERRLDGAVDAIKHKFGSGALVRAVSLTAAGQAHDRAGKIGGHYK